ncbi:MAG: hypothetical protein HYY48_07275 [Gammaproteobacteria bacterium]|nr:hypothetical protein [Gammaproteobacteria bacterium]
MHGVLHALFGFLAAAASLAYGTPEQCLSSGAASEAILQDRLMSRLGGAAAQAPGAIRADLARLEARFGPYDPRLLPGLIALGLRSREAGDHENASQAFGRALYVLRANDGLQSLDQLPIVKRLIEVRGELGDWRGVESAYALMHWLYRRNYDPGDPRMLPGLIRLRRWHIDAYNKETETTLATHVEEAERLYDQAAAIIRECHGDAWAVSCLLDGRCCVDAPSGESCPEAAVKTGLNSVTPGQSK